MSEITACNVHEVTVKVLRRGCRLDIFIIQVVLLYLGERGQFSIMVTRIPFLV